MALGGASGHISQCGTRLPGEFMSTWSSKNGTIWFQRFVDRWPLRPSCILERSGFLPDEGPLRRSESKDLLLYNRTHFWGVD